MKEDVVTDCYNLKTNLMSKPETPMHSVVNEEKQRNKPNIMTKIS